MDGSQINFRWSDAWLLLAIGIAAHEEPARLASVLTIADGIQHAIPVKEEMDGALSRLMRAGLVAFSGQTVRLLPAGQALTTNAQASNRFRLEQQRALEEALRAKSWTQAGVPQTARGAEPEILSHREWDVLMAPYSPSALHRTSLSVPEPPNER